MNTSIVIPVHNCLDYTKLCVESIRKCTEECELIIVDNGSDDGTIEWIREQPDIKWHLFNENKGFPTACNIGASLADPENDILILNNDVIVTIDWLKNLREHLWESEVGLAGDIIVACSNYVAGKQRITLPGYENIDELNERAYRHYIKRKGQRLYVNWAIAFCMLVRRSVWDEIGGFDERYGLGNSEDIDFCVAARKLNRNIIVARDVYIHHFGSITHKELNLDYKTLLEENDGKLREKWGDEEIDIRQSLDKS